MRRWDGNSCEVFNPDPFSFIMFSIKFLSFTFVSPISQIQAQLLMTPQIRPCTEYLTPFVVHRRQRFRCASSSSLVVWRTRLSTISDRAFPVANSFPAVQHPAADRHVGADTDCFSVKLHLRDGRPSVRLLGGVWHLGNVWRSIPSVVSSPNTLRCSDLVISGTIIELLLTY